MSHLRLETKNVSSFISKEDWLAIEPEVQAAQQMLLQRKGKGNEFLGWLDLPEMMNEELISSIQKEAEKLAKKAKIFVVIGIGGSYLGARAVIESLQHPFDAMQTGKNYPKLIYAGHTLSEDYMAALLDLLDTEEYAVAVISKSGTTTEPALAFRVIKHHLEKKYGKKEASERIIAITDEKRGALKILADKEGYPSYVIPDDIGGRYSVFTPVGLLPIAVAGYNIELLMKGARTMQRHCMQTQTLSESLPMQYVAIRNLLYRKSKKIEVLVNFLPSLVYITEWWKQLFGESEGKEGKGIFPAGVTFTTDLHSMGQYLQEGERSLFETVLSVDTPERRVSIPLDEDDLDGLNFLSCLSMTEINHKAMQGTTLAHVDGGVPVMEIRLSKLNEETLGELLYFFEYSCGLSGYLLGVNPFDQPGVEAYKRNMFALLGKPGFEKEGNELKKRLLS